MRYLITSSKDEFATRTAAFREHIEPYLKRMESALAAGGEVATYVEPDPPAGAQPLLRRYRRIVAWPVRQLEYSFVLDAVPPRPGIRVLDAGCGITPLPHVYAAQGGDSHAVDGYAGLVDLLSREGGRLYGGAVQYSAQDITKLDYPDGFFDAVMSISVLEHLPRGLDTAAVREMLRVLKPNGTLVLTVDIIPTPKPPTLRERIRSALRPIRRALSGAPKKPKSRTQQYTLDEVREQILDPFADVIEGRDTHLAELDAGTVRRFWTELWVDGCGYDPVAGRRYASLGLVLTKR